MMGIIKELVRRTPLYEIIKRRRIEKSLRTWDESDQKRVGFYSQFVRAGDVCFDIGANIGNRSKVFLKLGTKVIAVEPQKACVAILKRAFGGNDRFILIEKAAGETIGQAEIMISSIDTISSMSSQWIEAVKKSGRFGGSSWDRKQIVPVTTLDALIAEYGQPAFIKIDVEGYEYAVVKGLSRPIPALSFEFTPEVFDSTVRCIEHLSSLDTLHLNYSLGESMQLVLDKWVPASQLIDVLSEKRNDHRLFGDVYARFDKFAKK